MMVDFFNMLFGSKEAKEKVDFGALLENGAILLDVRTKAEYKQGAAAGSINIPLDHLGKNLSKLKKDKPIIAVCASGMRSRSAVSKLKAEGFQNVYNGGSWFNFE